MDELHFKHSAKRTFGLLLRAIFCAIPLIKDCPAYRSAISERLFKSVKGSIVLLSDICDIVKGKQINGEK